MKIIYGNFKTKSSMTLSPDPDLTVEELKRIHLQCCVWMKALNLKLL